MDLAQQTFEEGLSFLHAGNDLEATRAFQRAIHLVPSYPPSWINLAIALRNLGDYEGSVKTSRMAIKLATGVNVEEAYNNLAVALLALGQWKEGWAAFDHRLNIPIFSMQMKAPLWTGQDLTGKTLMLRAEQGAGDEIMMARYIPQLKQMCQTFAYSCTKPLLRLWQGQPWAAGIVWEGEVHVDYELPVMSCAQRFGTTPETVPWSGPYVIDPGCPQRPLPEGEGTRIGFTFSGNPKHPRDKIRNIDLEHWTPLFELRNCTWYNFNLGIEIVNYPIHNLRLLITDWADTASLLSQMDCVVTIDTGLAHLAGAMGIKTYLLLPYVADYRWLLKKRSTPWYPTIQLIRQRAAGDWTYPMQRMRDLLAS